MALSRASVYLIVFAALNGLIAVVTQSLAAHGIETIAPAGAQAINWFYDASDFQMNMALGIVFVALLHDRVVEGRPRKLIFATGVLFGCSILKKPASLSAAMVSSGRRRSAAVASARARRLGCRSIAR